MVESNSQNAANPKFSTSPARVDRKWDTAIPQNYGLVAVSQTSAQELLWDGSGSPETVGYVAGTHSTTTTIDHIAD